MKFNFPLRSSVPHIGWPPIPNSSAAQSISMLNYLELTQWYDPRYLLEQQKNQLLNVLDYAKKFVPLYQSYSNLNQINLENFWEHWYDIPLLSRKDLQNFNKQIFSTEAIPEHGKSVLSQTSGSTGRPISILGNQATQFFWNIFNLRDHFWHQRNFQGTLAIIRPTADKESKPPLGRSFSNWGESTANLMNTGPALHLNPCNTEDEVSWLERVNPDYLLCFPSILKGILRVIRAQNTVIPNLKEVRTISEIVEPSLRELTLETLNVPIKDVYSAKEAGYIAIQCPDSNHYHVQSENIFLELLNEQNKPCQAGETGRIVLTTLHNFSSPLIRYEIGDYATQGEMCACGRGLPVLTQIKGRQRNLIKFPNGKHAWPSLSRDGLSFNALFPLWQYQFTQHALDTLTCKLTCPPCKPEVEQTIRERIQFLLDYPFKIEFIYTDKIDRDPSGKYEDFKSMID